MWVACMQQAQQQGLRQAWNSLMASSTQAHLVKLRQQAGLPQLRHGFPESLILIAQTSQILQNGSLSCMPLRQLSVTASHTWPLS